MEPTSLQLATLVNTVLIDEQNLVEQKGEITCHLHHVPELLICELFNLKNTTVPFVTFQIRARECTILIYKAFHLKKWQQRPQQINNTSKNIHPDLNRKTEFRMMQ